MRTTVLLKDIVDALEMQFDESSSFLDLDTGQVETVSHDLLGEAEETGEEEPGLFRVHRNDPEGIHIFVENHDLFRGLDDLDRKEAEDRHAW